LSGFLLIILSGIATGSAYGLMALGKVIIFKSTNTVNFAIGDIGTLAAYVALSAELKYDLPPVAGLVIAVLVAGIVGVGAERFLVRPLGRNTNAIFISLVMMIGFGLFIRAFIGYVWGHQAVAFPSVISGSVLVFGIEVGAGKLVAGLLAFVAMGLVAWFFSKNIFGIAMRAAAEDPYAAKLTGFNSSRIAMIAWFLGSGLASVGIFFLAAENSLYPTFAFVPLFRALSGVFLGGFTSMAGAVVGGVIIGVLDNVSAAFISDYFRDSIVFGVIVLFLFLRPAGILGKTTKERV
jgi:branched-chain amino acid transport system permease protein